MEWPEMRWEKGQLAKVVTVAVPNRERAVAAKCTWRSASTTRAPDPPFRIRRACDAKTLLGDAPCSSPRSGAKQPQDPP
jgi:hypothetical protein